MKELGFDPENIVSDLDSMTGLMGRSQRIWFKSQRLWQELWGGARGYGVRARGYGVRARGYGTLKILVSAPGP